MIVRWSVAGAVLLCGSIAVASAATTATQPGGWYEFQGTWTAAGSRNTLNMGTDRYASVGDFTGSLVLSGPSRPNLGFRAEAIVFNDSTSGMVGRAVWTDQRGDQIFSEIRGTGTKTGGKVSGTFVGGTGRYAGATGSYNFTWQFVIQTEDGNVSGRAADVSGRVRFGSGVSALNAGGQHS
jgi:hypothetical protein